MCHLLLVVILQQHICNHANLVINTDGQKYADGRNTPQVIRLRGKNYDMILATAVDHIRKATWPWTILKVQKGHKKVTVELFSVYGKCEYYCIYMCRCVYVAT